MAVIIDLSEDSIKKIEKIRFLIGGKEDRDLQSEIINAIKNRKSTDEMIAEIEGYARFHKDKVHNDVERGKYLAYEKSLEIIHKYCDKENK